MNKQMGIALGCALSASLLAGTATAGDEMYKYEVTVTNLTRGVSFTPIMAAIHRDGVRLYQLGQPPSDALAAMAEGGNTAPLADIVRASHHGTTASSMGLLDAGKSVTITVPAYRDAKFLSLAAMMLPTNDGFISVNSVALPMGNDTATYLSNGHDAGSEPNDEICANIPGPTCHGTGGSPGVGGEGFVHIHAGIHGIGSLHPEEYDWRNPVARISVKRLVHN